MKYLKLVIFETDFYVDIVKIRSMNKYEKDTKFLTFY